MGEIVEKKVEYKVERKSEAERKLEDVADEADGSYRDLKTGYEKEKIKEKLD